MYVFETPPGESDAWSSLRTTGVGNGELIEK